MGKLNLILLFCLLFLLQIAYWQKRRADDVEKQKDLYKQNNQLLLTKIKKVYDDKVATDLRIKELEQEALKDKGVFDWNIDISNTNVIKGLKR